MRSLAIAVALASLIAVASADAQEAKLPPADEAAKDTSWSGFRTRLLNALAQRDRKFVLSILDRNIRNGFGGPDGVAEFRRQWDFDAEESPLWRELPSVLFLGSAYVKSEKRPIRVCAPYVMPKWPDTVDPFGHGAIVVKEALVKAEPSAASATIATLSHDIVAVTDWDAADATPETRQRWVKVKLKGAEGYVPEEHIRSPVEHTACFVRTANGWRMVSLLAGED